MTTFFAGKPGKPLEIRLLYREIAMLCDAIEVYLEDHVL